MKNYQSLSSCGFWQTMGMAVMLDVVISYVQSLQNQIEVTHIVIIAN